MRKKTYPSRYPVKVGFSRSVVVGNHIIVSGCSGQTLETFHVSSEDVIEQTEVALEKIRGAIEEAQGSMEDIVKIVFYLIRMDDYPGVEKKMRDYFWMHAPRLIREPPAATVVCVPALHEPDLLVEIDSWAVIADQ